MTREKGLEIANLIWHIENTEAAIEELNREFFNEMEDSIFEEFDTALQERLQKLNAELEAIKCE